MMSKVLSLALLCLFASVNATGYRSRSRGFFRDRMPFTGCSGSATYNVTFRNLLTPQGFGSLIPKTGLVYSPITAVGHSNRVSILTVRGFATKPIEAVAETGDNTMLVGVLRTLRRTGGVKSFSVAPGGTTPGSRTVVSVQVDCKNPYISAVAMIAPSPDWIVQISNMNMYSDRFGKFASFKRGVLIAYDAGTDNGRAFTPPDDPSLDKPTVPAKNIAPLVEDVTDRFRGRPVGIYYLSRTN